MKLGGEKGVIARCYNALVWGVFCTIIPAIPVTNLLLLGVKIGNKKSKTNSVHSCDNPTEHDNNKKVDISLCDGSKASSSLVYYLILSRF